MAIVDKGDCAVVIYFDDIVIYGTDPSVVWAETLLVLKRLTSAGFMINIKKCRFLVSSMKMLGHVIAGDCQKLIFTSL